MTEDYGEKKHKQDKQLQRKQQNHILRQQQQL